MKLVKSFDYFEEIAPVIKDFADDFLEMIEASNDTAVRYCIESDTDNETIIALNNYLLSMGCTPEEDVYIWISW